MAGQPDGVTGCGAVTRRLVWTAAAAQGGAEYGVCFRAGAAGTRSSSGAAPQRCFSIAVGKCRSGQGWGWNG